GELEAALELRVGLFRFALAQRHLRERDERVGEAGLIAERGVQLERLVEVAARALEVAEVGVGLADVGELDADAGAIAELLREPQGALVVHERFLVLAEADED